MGDDRGQTAEGPANSLSRTYRGTKREGEWVPRHFSFCVVFSPLAAPSDEARPPSSIAFGAPEINQGSLSFGRFLWLPLARYSPLAARPPPGAEEGHDGDAQATTSRWS